MRRGGGGDGGAPTVVAPRPDRHGCGGAGLRRGGLGHAVGVPAWVPRGRQRVGSTPGVGRNSAVHLGTGPTVVAAGGPGDGGRWIDPGDPAVGGPAGGAGPRSGRHACGARGGRSGPRGECLDRPARPGDHGSEASRGVPTRIRGCRAADLERRGRSDHGQHAVRDGRRGRPGDHPAGGVARRRGAGRGDPRRRSRGGLGRRDQEGEVRWLTYELVDGADAYWVTVAGTGQAIADRQDELRQLLGAVRWRTDALPDN